MLPSRLVDLRMNGPLPPLEIDRHLHLGHVTAARGRISATEGVVLGMAQVTIALHVGPPVRLDWRLPAGPLRSRHLRRGMACVHGVDAPLWLRWSAPSEFLAVALDTHFAFDAAVDCSGGWGGLETVVGVDDWQLRRLGALFDRELRDAGTHGALYLDSLGMALAVHVLRRYGRKQGAGRPARGGIAPARLRRVLEHVEEHLAENVSLADLARVAGLALHHFAHAFKESTGMSPHHFILERRIARARMLLVDSRLCLAEIALMLGFADQSHFTEHFRRLTGITPARYRRNL